MNYLENDNEFLYYIKNQIYKDVCLMAITYSS